MITAVAALSVAFFMGAFWLVRIVPQARRAIAVARESLAAIGDPALDDDARERLMRRGSLTLFGAFLQIAVRSAVALAAALVPIVLADWAGLAPRAQVFDFLARGDVIAAFTAATLLAWILCARAWRNR